MKTHRFAAGAVSIALAVTMVSSSAFAASVKFTDVPSNHWAATSISAMSDKGIMTGVADGVFAPSSTLTYAEFLAMVTRQFCADKLTGAPGENWYSEYLSVAEGEGLTAGIAMASPLGVISRYDMAQIIFNVIKYKGQPLPVGENGWGLPQFVRGEEIGDRDIIPDNYEVPVWVCYYYAILTGTDSNGTFSGASNMDRAQAAIVMDRLIAMFDNTPPSYIPAGAKQITKLSELLTKDGMWEYPRGFHADPTRVTRGSAGMGMDSKGYSTFTFTFKAADTDTCIEYRVDPENAGYLDPMVLKESVVVKAGETKTFTFDCSKTKHVGLAIYNVEKETPYSFSEGWITNIYFY